MEKARHPHTRYNQGSTGFHTAVPPQASDGGSGGVPLSANTPPLPKPAVLATRFPEPSHGTPGTAISAHTRYPGPTLPRPQRSDGGKGQPSATRWKGWVKRINKNVKQWLAQIRREYLKLLRSHLALTTTLTFGYVRLITFLIGVSRRILQSQPALPYGLVTRFVHDRRYALFPAGGRVIHFRESPQHGDPPGKLLGERRSGQPKTD